MKTKNQNNNKPHAKQTVTAATGLVGPDGQFFSFDDFTEYKSNKFSNIDSKLILKEFLQLH